ncbi:F-box only protein 47 [Intoshia linei]|uniref:F-box only protein 47 n=1 Tax=Intoshia linei TaxID=1819745 RepID=A0A177ASV9_9BILA|nr:F-box only protein 47 [Intoshia linei]
MKYINDFFPTIKGNRNDRLKNCKRFIKLNDIVKYKIGKWDNNTFNFNLNKKIETDFYNLESSIGYFVVLSNELKYFILQRLSMKSLGMLACCSKPLKNMIFEFLNSKWAKDIILRPYKLEHSSVDMFMCSNKTKQKYIIHFKSCGYLLKRVSFLEPSSNRLEIFFDYFKSLICYQNSCKDPINCICLYFYGIAFKCLLKGWYYTEIRFSLTNLFERCSIDTLMTEVLSKDFGACMKKEVIFKNFMQKVVCRPYNNDLELSEKIYFIIEPYTTSERAIILFIIYGPISREKIIWHDMTQRTFPKELEKNVFGNISIPIKLLHENHQDWSNTDTLNVLNEIISNPSSWLAENVALLLYFCGPEIITFYVTKYIGNDMKLSGKIFAHLALVFIKYENSLHFIINLITQMIQRQKHRIEKENYVCNITNHIKKLINNYLESFVDDNILSDIRCLQEAQQNLIVYFIRNQL